ncbi:MAG: hypothetical protein M3P41_13040 [Actinomycetota bacterium]|jgi:hypothetical protein|nr:hypothetical protein [Actinomycetota bacterium]
MDRPSRLEATRRKLRLTRYAVVVASTAAFAGVAFVARAAHTGATAPASSGAAGSQNATAQSSSFDDFGSSAIAPSSGAGPLVQSGGS